MFNTIWTKCRHNEKQNNIIIIVIIRKIIIICSISGVRRGRTGALSAAAAPLRPTCAFRSKPDGLLVRGFFSDSLPVRRSSAFVVVAVRLRHRRHNCHRPPALRVLTTSFCLTSISPRTTEIRHHQPCR